MGLLGRESLELEAAELGDAPSIRINDEPTIVLHAQPVPHGSTDHESAGCGKPARTGDHRFSVQHLDFRAERGAGFQRTAGAVPEDTMVSEDGESKRAALVYAYRRLASEGLLLLSAGNLSLRAGDRILITPTGADQSIEPEQIVLIDRNGEVAGEGIPSSEWPMHAAIYEARPDVMAIVHTHSDACTALSCLRQPLPAFHYMVAFFGTDEIPCAPYAHFGSPALARGAADMLGTGNACLLANHGMISVGRSMAEAAKGASLLEMLARQYILALQAGSPVLLSPDDMAEARRRYGYYGRARIPQA